MDKCNVCGSKMPSELFAPLFVDGKTTTACPICSMAIRNAALGLPLDTEFVGEHAAQLVEDAWQYYNPTVKDPYKFLKGNK